MPSRWLFWRRPQLPVAEQLDPQEARVISAWNLTVDAWRRLTDQERAKLRFDYLKAPNFIA